MEVSGKFRIITIDGPAGAGKSTIARQLSHRLGFSYLDTGAMYRALTFKALCQQIPLEDEGALVLLARQTMIDLKQQADTLTVYLDGQDVSISIRTQEVTNNTFYIARAPGVREVMVQWQRDIGKRCNLVVEGRDVGTVVFPQADIKFYLDADFNERCRRRMEELKLKGQKVDEVALKKDLQQRDYKDFTRAVGPLKKALDAVVIDSTNLSVVQVVDAMMTHIDFSKV